MIYDPTKERKEEILQELINDGKVRKVDLYVCKTCGAEFESHHPHGMEGIIECASQGEHQKYYPGWILKCDVHLTNNKNKENKFQYGVLVKIEELNGFKQLSHEPLYNIKIYDTETSLESIYNDKTGSELYYEDVGELSLQNVEIISKWEESLEQKSTED